MRAPLMIIAAGGTGGHMFPAQALAEAMLAKGWRVRLSTDARGARYTGGFPDAVEVSVVGSATFARGGIAAKLAVPFRILGGALSAVGRMIKDRPVVVVGFGGYPAIPAMTAAWVLRIPRMIHEQNGVLGRVNQAFAKRVDQIACGNSHRQPCACRDFGAGRCALYSARRLSDVDCGHGRVSGRAYSVGRGATRYCEPADGDTSTYPCVATGPRRRYRPGAPVLCR